MREFSYTIVADDLDKARKYYQDQFGWFPLMKDDHYVFLDTGSLMKFGLVKKEYLFEILPIKEEELPTMSFVTWLYESEDELRREKKELIANGLKKIADSDSFFMDSEGNIWELRIKGDSI